jgi:hypothetical protein
MKNVEKADRIHLGGLIEELKKGHFVIPDFQREFEWQPWDVLDLIKSIFKDYYIGTLLLWKGSKENYKMLSCDQIYGFKGKPDPQHIVLDGQQRLTAIYFTFFQPNIPFPRRAKPMVYFLNIVNLLDEDYEKAFWYDSLTKNNVEFLNNKEAQFERHTFPLSVMQEGTWGTSDWIKAYRDYWQLKIEKDIGDDEDSLKRKILYNQYVINAKEFKDSLEELFNQYYLSYIELDRDIDVAKVCDIFTQINSKGVTLDIFDLLNAILRPKDIHLRQMWYDAEDLLSYTDPKKMKIYVLQVMSILEQYYCSAKYLYYLVPEVIKTIKKPDGTKEQIVLVSSSEDFINKWNHSVKALKKAIMSLKSPRDFGAITPGFVPYPSIIPAYTAIKAFVEGSDAVNKLDIQTKIRKWYWASIFTNKYSSSVESTSAKDFQDLKKWFENDFDEPEVITEFITKYKSMDLLNDNPKGSAIYNAIFNLFVINEARDWATFDLPEYDSLDDHHIVPASLFREEAGSTINSILNRTPLSASTNRKIIRNRMPNEYIKEMLDNNDPDKVYGVLESHLVSKKAVEILLKVPFTKNDFQDFLQERQITIKTAIEDMLIKERIKVPVALQSLNKNIENVELSLRNLIAKCCGDEINDYESTTPDNIQEKVEKRINTEIRKNPSLNMNSFNSFSKRLKYFDLSEYFEIIVNKANWDKFSSFFNNKEQLQYRFNQLSVLRNGIRHSRDVSDFEKLDGEAAIQWFNQVFSKL